MSRNRHTGPSKYRGTMIASVLLVAAILTLIWGIIPTLKTIRTLLSDVNLLRSQTASLQNKLTFLNSLSEEEMKADLIELLKGVPFGRTVPTVLSTVLDVSSTSQVNLKDLSMDASTKLATASANTTEDLTTTFTPSTPEIAVSVSIGADREKTRVFLDTIQNVRRILSIQRASATFLEDGNIDTVLTLNGFSLPMLEGGVASDSALIPFTPEDKTVINKISSLPAVGEDLPQAPQKPANPKPDPFAKF